MYLLLQKKGRPFMERKPIKYEVPDEYMAKGILHLVKESEMEEVSSDGLVFL